MPLNAKFYEDDLRAAPEKDEFLPVWTKHFLDELSDDGIELRALNLLDPIQIERNRLAREDADRYLQWVHTEVHCTIQLRFSPHFVLPSPVNSSWRRKCVLKDFFLRLKPSLLHLPPPTSSSLSSCVSLESKVFLEVRHIRHQVYILLLYGSMRELHLYIAITLAGLGRFDDLTLGFTVHSIYIQYIDRCLRHPLAASKPVARLLLCQYLRITH